MRREAKFFMGTAKIIYSGSHGPLYKNHGRGILIGGKAF